jgi:hypothetical protein
MNVNNFNNTQNQDIKNNNHSTNIQNINFNNSLTKIQIENQIDSKDWKMRKNCYQNILKNLENENLKFEEILFTQINSNTNEILIDYLPKIPEDNLPQSLEIGLEVIFSILKINENDNQYQLINDEIKYNIMKNILDKSIFSIKSSCKEKSKEIIMFLFEYNFDLFENFLDLFSKIFESNKPKVILISIFLFNIMIN